MGSTGSMCGSPIYKVKAQVRWCIVWSLDLTRFGTTSKFLGGDLVFIKGRDMYSKLESRLVWLPLVWTRLGL